MTTELLTLAPTATKINTGRCTDTLQFAPMSINDMDTVRRILTAHTPASRTCDFSVGGLFMWIDYFRYEMAVSHGTLFISGLNEKDLSTQAFSMPVGTLPLVNALALLRRYCRENNIPCVLSAVPASDLERIRLAAPILDIEPLDDWSDYLYDMSSMSNFSGKKMSKKRNHVNRFMADHPDYSFTTLDDSNIDAVRNFFAAQELDTDKSVSADYERLQVLEVLRHPALFGFEGAVLSTPTDGVVAFTMGEVLGDTLYVHIEKMDHNIAGAGETVCQLYARMMSDRYGESLRFINREEDTGDEGLRRAKMSYHPVEILRKYNVTLQV